MSILFNRPIITGSVISGMKETQENNITSDIESIRATPETLKTAYDRIIRSDVKYRFVLDTRKWNPSLPLALFALLLCSQQSS